MRYLLLLAILSIAPIAKGAGVGTFGTGFSQDILTVVAQSTIVASSQDFAAVSASTVALNASKLNRAGDTMTGDLIFSNAHLKITPVGDSAIAVGSNTFGGPTALSITTNTASFSYGAISLRNEGTGNTGINQQSFGTNAFLGGGFLTFTRARGTPASPSALLANDVIASFSANGHSGTAYSFGNATLSARVASGWSSTSRHTEWLFNTTSSGTTAGSITLTVRRDTTTVNAGMLQVNGAINATGNATASSFSGDGSGLTSVTATTNANLTGPVASIGNATTIVGPIPPDTIDLSTVTSALSGKRNNGEAIEAAAIDLSTVTVALGGKRNNGEAIEAAAVDLSTVTTALGLKADLAGATFTGASGITNQAFTATGANGNIISASSMTASGFFGASLEIGSNIVYYCTGSTTGTFDGNLARGNGNAGACLGGTWVATSLKVD